MKAITTYIRTKSGRRVAKLVYVSKDDYDKIQKGEVDANFILKKYVKDLKDGETIDGWEEAEMKAIKTFVRTKSGRLIEKVVMVSKADYERLQKVMKEGGDPAKMAAILGQYMSVEEGQTIEGFKKLVPESAPMKVIIVTKFTKSNITTVLLHNFFSSLIHHFLLTTTSGGEGHGKDQEWTPGRKDYPDD